MGASLVLQGVPALAYFKSKTLSFRCGGSKGNWYEFRHDEVVPVYVSRDVEAFRAHENLIECTAQGESLVPPTESQPRSYRKIGSPSMTVSPKTKRASDPDKFDKEIAEMEKRRKARLARYED